MTKDESDAIHARLRLSCSKAYENGALVQDALDEMVKEFGDKYCPLKTDREGNVYTNDVYCDGEKCAVFNNGDIAIIPDHHYTISVKPHCGLIKS